MAAVLNNIYPPIVSTYAPAFLLEDKVCIIPFIISNLNSAENIKNVQVAIVYQDTNISALDENKYPSGIKLTNFKKDNNNNLSELTQYYYIEINDEDLTNGFEINQYYKVQIRFTGTSAEDYNIATIPQKIDTWLATERNRNSFSEWSTIILTRGISKPTLVIDNFDANADSTVWTAASVELYGKLTFENNLETDSLKQYRVRVYDEYDELIADSGNQFPSSNLALNEINHVVKYNFIDGKDYLLVVNYETQVGYQGVNEYPFIYFELGYDKIIANIYPVLDEENGRIGLRLSGEMSKHTSNNLVYRRASSETNYQVWEDVRNVTVEDNIFEYIWYDQTVKSGVYYKYGVQKRDSLGNRGAMLMLREPQMIEFEHMFLLHDNRQLKIKFDPQISSFQRVVQEGKVDTLGSKYPFVTRNGYTDYKQFPIAGLISFFSDENGLFLDREKFYGEELTELYDNYNSNIYKRINPHIDTIYERDFRDEVMDFLYDNTVKLFRSPTEGNILVKLTNISFTPNQTLGRHIYSFNCTAVEIDEATIDNYDFYNIQSVGTYSQNLTYKDSFIGQYNGVPSTIDSTYVSNILVNLYQEWQEQLDILAEDTTITVDEYNKKAEELAQYYTKLINQTSRDKGKVEEIMDLISENYSKNVPAGWSVGNSILDYLKITFNSDPYLIDMTGDIPDRLVDYTSDTAAMSHRSTMRRTMTRSAETMAAAILGYIIYIDDKPIVVDKNGIYELKGHRIELNSIKIPYGAAVSIDYHIQYGLIEDKSQLFQSVVYQQQVGQKWGTFKMKHSIYQDLWKHYLQLYNDYKQYMVALNALKIEADEGTIVYIKKSNEDNYERFIIGNTELLEFYDNESVIENFYFAGMYLEETDSSTEIRPTEFYNTDLIIDDLNNINDKVVNGVYTLSTNNKQYIWYHSQWYEFIDGHIVACPIDAMVDYYCDVMKGYFVI